jgi:hypothetical protein
MNKAQVPEREFQIKTNNNNDTNTKRTSTKAFRKKHNLEKKVQKKIAQHDFETIKHWSRRTTAL